MLFWIMITPSVIYQYMHDFALEVFIYYLLSCIILNRLQVYCVFVRGVQRWAVKYDIIRRRSIC